MQNVLIIFNAEAQEGQKIFAASPVTSKMVNALENAIADNAPSTQVNLISAAALWSKSHKEQLSDPNLIYCPLTIELPYWLSFPAQKIFQACRDIEGRRHWVEEKLGYKTSINNSWFGDLWLPVVLTDKGPLYGEVIGEGAIPNAYEQPVKLRDKIRQPLYHLASQLLDSLKALPSVYLLQFRLLNDEIVFDRLWPFPAAPAISSINSQQPDLFTCHWYCLTQQPIANLASFRKKS